MSCRLVPDMDGDRTIQKVKDFVNERFPGRTGAGRVPY